MAKLPGAYETLATVGAPAINFARGILGYQDPFLTQTMQDRMKEIEGGRTRGNVGYEDYGLDSSAGRFTGGLMNLAINNPVDFGLAGSIGKYDFGPEGRKGLTYDFTTDKDTGSTGNVILDFINRGGLKGAFSRMGTAEASDLGAIANNEMIQAILNPPKTPKSATTFLESMNRGPRVEDDPYSPEFFPNNQQGSLEVDMGATGIVPELARRITPAMDIRGDSVANFQGFFDKEDFSKAPEPSGLRSLISSLSPLGLLRRIAASGQPFQRFTPGTTINTPLSAFGGDFYNPRTGLNRFDRAAQRFKKTGSMKDLFAASRSGSEFFRRRREELAKRERRAKAANQQRLANQQYFGGGDDNSFGGGITKSTPASNTYTSSNYETAAYDRKDR